MVAIRKIADEYLTAAAGPTSHSPPPIDVAAMMAPGPMILKRLRALNGGGAGRSATSQRGALRGWMAKDRRSSRGTPGSACADDITARSSPRRCEEGWVTVRSLFNRRERRGRRDPLRSFVYHRGSRGRRDLCAEHVCFDSLVRGRGRRPRAGVGAEDEKARPPTRARAPMRTLGSSALCGLSCGISLDHRHNRPST